MRLGLVTLVVRDYDEAIDFYVNKVGFRLVNDDAMGRGKRWVVVAPEHGPGLLLARADGPRQHRRIGNQAGGRVAFFMHTADFAATHARMSANGVRFLEAPRAEPYGMVCVWQDLYGNKWDLLEDRPGPTSVAAPAE